MDRLVDRREDRIRDQDIFGPLKVPNLGKYIIEHIQTSLDQVLRF